jgi:hypothetical protein
LDKSRKDFVFKGDGLDGVLKELASMDCCLQVQVRLLRSKAEARPKKIQLSLFYALI